MVAENTILGIDGTPKAFYNWCQNTRSVHRRKGFSAMTETEKEMIHFIRNSSNPEKALEIAIAVIIEYLQQLESSPKPSPDSLQESA